ncbi:MAG TPA: tRNA 2-thiouridine(34) synthase MnmA [Polyangiaceae bacterium]|nr:tRNA 2-thiouridine(34) synthase MnmA [Polyangiaceae bacterium]
MGRVVARERILIAMSGGVDSSVAAAWLVQQGYDVVGVTLHLWDYPDDGSVRGRCCAPEDQHDARRVADHLGIAHYAFDRRELFAREVVTPFVDAYLAGSTPSPCVACNRSVKMAELFALADRLGARKVATGHYARTVRHGDRVELHRAADTSKDQSYFLHTLSQSQLARLAFPLGEASKTEVRASAVALGLPGAGKGESQELCFVPTGRYDAFVDQRAGDRARPGAIVDGEGRVVGAHQGVHRFTIGQRKGLGVALGSPAYVVDIDVATAEVRLGGAADLFHSGARLRDAKFVDDVALPVHAAVKVRYRHEGASARVLRDAAGVYVAFDQPVRAVARGQVAVAYAGDRVLGGGTIECALSGACA